MKPVVKGLLIGCVAITVLAATAVVFIGRYIAANKDRWRAKGTAVLAEGTQFGENVAEPRCVTEALNKYRSDSSLTGFVRTRLWLTGCLRSSAIDPAFCNGIPEKSEIIATVTWRLAECRRQGFEGDSTCPKILDEVQTYCHGAERARKLAKR